MHKLFTFFLSGWQLIHSLFKIPKQFLQDKSHSFFKKKNLFYIFLVFFAYNLIFEINIIIKIKKGEKIIKLTIANFIIIFIY